VARFKTGKETREIEVPISPMSIVGYVALSQLPLIINDPHNKEELASIHKRLNFPDKFDKGSTFKTRNIICILILDSGVLMGVIQIINKKDAAFTEADLTLANAIAEIMGKKFRYELGGTSQPFDYLII
jgi:GAF domain-containing protein